MHILKEFPYRSNFSVRLKKQRNIQHFEFLNLDFPQVVYILSLLTQSSQVLPIFQIAQKTHYYYLTCWGNFMMCISYPLLYAQT